MQEETKLLLMLDTLSQVALRSKSKTSRQYLTFKGEILYLQQPYVVFH